eukprot:1236106-Alexandrium_andersonii.AAC.1
MRATARPLRRPMHLQTSMPARNHERTCARAHACTHAQTEMHAWGRRKPHTGPLARAAMHRQTSTVT